MFLHNWERTYFLFLSCIVTGDEKWCLYANISKRKEWLSTNKKATPRTKTCAHPQKIMLCIWWNSKSVLYYELLPRGVTIIADIYCQQLRCLADAIQEKRPTRLHEVMLLHDNGMLQTNKLKLFLYNNTGVRLGSHSAPTSFTWSCGLRFSPFLLSVEQPSRNFLSRWKCASNMAWWLLQLKTTLFLQVQNWKVTPALADCCK